MSLIGTLEQFGLANVLQRCEHFEKTGVLILKQGPSWIEFYLNAGHLRCVGPLRTNANLGERLLHDGIISQQVLQEVFIALQPLQLTELTESQFARTLLERGYVGRDDLRRWTINNTVSVLKVLLTWTTGEMYFDENTLPPADRLLVDMTLSSLLDLATTSFHAVPATAPISPQPQPTPVATQTSGQPLRYPEPVQPPVQREPMVSPPLSVPPKQFHPSGPLSAPTLLTSTVPPVEPAVSATPSPDVARVPTLMSASQFLDDSSYSVPQQASPAPATDTGVLHDPGSLSAAELFAGVDFGSLSAAELVPAPDFDAIPSSDAISHSDVVPPRDTEPARLDSGFLSLFGSADDNANNGLLPAVPVAQPQPPQCIDISFLRPEMVLLPADLSAGRQQNSQIQITPDQWCLLTYVDGQTPLSVICQLLNAAPELVCRVAGELMFEGLIYPSSPDAAQSFESSPVSREMVASGLGGGYVAPGYASAAASPWSASMPNVPSAPGKPVETESQWGNGGNGATFIPGRGWIATPQPMLPLQPNGSTGRSDGLAMPGAPSASAPLNGAQSGIYAAPGNGSGY